MNAVVKDWIPRHRITVDEYYRMAEVGLLPCAGVELIDGLIVDRGGRQHRITVDDYYRMAEVGLLAPDARVELINGEIIDMAPMGSRHAATVTRLDRLLSRAIGERANMRVQLPVRLGTVCEPEPDLTVVRLRQDDYAKAHPTAYDTLLIVEVSETSLRVDREIKVPLYAQYGVPEVWIVDLNTDQVHFFRSPDGGGYADVFSESKPAVVALTGLPGVTVDLSGFLRF